MAAEGWQHVKAVFQAALDREPEQRAAYVRQACGGDRALAAEVESLLAAHQRADSFAERPAIEVLDQAGDGQAGRVLQRGDTFGSYEITEWLGAGGMGEVYRARDIKLGRDVAIKILPRVFTDDPERLARFEREARVLASLNHPDIGAIYGLEDAGGIRALVLELVEGPTLADRLTSGPLPVNEALPIARQIAEALEAAHERGIVHRDLKPANIKVTPDGRVKVLDFGLAKWSAGEGREPDLSQATAASGRATRGGEILGTAAYMSPEQARGLAVDKRSDIWAFGCVLYEVLTGRQAFSGPTLSDTIAAILEHEPDWDTLSANVPPTIRILLRRCLEKDRRKRIADISAALFVFEDYTNFAPAPGPHDSAPIPKEQAEAQTRAAVTATRRELAQSTRRRLGLVGALAMLLGAAAAGTGVWLATRAASTPVTRLVIPSSGATALSVQGNDRDLAITPDGTHLVYHGTNDLLVRSLDRLDATVIGSFNGPRGVFVSPDGKWVGFVDGAGYSPLRKVAITGGPAVTLTMTDAASRGATWGEDGTIIYATSFVTGLQRISSEGGTSTVLTRPDRARGEADHLWPEFLPGGQAVLFTITVSTGGLDNAQVAVLDLRTGTYATVLRGGYHAHYVPTGHLVYGANGALRAVPFDLGRREVTGPPVQILDGVVTGANGGVNMTIAANGTLVYVPGRGGVGPQRSLVWVDRMGREALLTAPVRDYHYPRLSPDGTRVALDIRDQQQDIWIWDFARQTLTPLTFGASLDVYPVWTADSQRIVFSSDRAGQGVSLYSQAADGTGGVEQLTESARAQAPNSMTPGGNVLVLREDAPSTGFDLLSLSLGSAQGRLRGDGAPQPLVQSPFTELNGEVSPDGRWLAYQSNESGGRDEIYVRPYPDVTAGRWQVSTGGGRTPLWARTGRELFYRSADRAVMAVRVEPGPVWRGSPPTQALPALYYDDTGTTGRTFDIAPDGQRFLMIKNSDLGEAQIVVVQNWTEELKRLVPAK